MGSLKADGEVKKELDDSGYVQDEVPGKSSPESRHIHLLDLSDDVLLYILGHCEPADLKALGFTCLRLASLIRDRSLWNVVDARRAPAGRRRLRWLLAHALHAGTARLLLRGRASECGGCQGHVNRLRKEVEAKQGDKVVKPGASTQQPRIWPREYPFYSLPRPSVSPSWPKDDPLPRAEEGSPPLQCPGPQFTLTACLLRQMAVQCNLTQLALEYCNINCNTISLTHFPTGLTWLSLRGAKCFNMPLDKSFLFKIQDHLPNLEHLDLSECTWLDPSCLLPLSKLGCLRRLLARNCPRMSEFVAYASLAGRYGFRKLQVFDLRGSPLGDSEVAALGWLPELEELYLSATSPPSPPAPADTHHHYKDDVLVRVEELEDWEKEEPEYFKSLLKQHKHRRNKGRPADRCYHGLPFNHCTDGFGERILKKGLRDLKRKKNAEDPGPSKRKKSSPDDDASSSSESDYDDDEEEMSENGEDKDSEKETEFNSEEEDNEANGEAVNGEARIIVVNNAIRPDRIINIADAIVQDNREAIDEVHVRIEAMNNEAGENENQNIEVRPRAHLLYVNVGHQLHPVYRLAIPNEPVVNDGRRRPPAEIQQHHRVIMTSPNRGSPSIHNLITDSAIRSFGHSDDDNINYFHIGGPPNAQHCRPNKSNLRILSVVGYRNITDRSLLHLRSSAPKLEKIDFSRTSVTQKGVDTFKVRRPDVEVEFSPFVDPEAIDYRVQGGND